MHNCEGAACSRWRTWAIYSQKCSEHHWHSRTSRCIDTHAMKNSHLTRPRKVYWSNTPEMQFVTKIENENSILRTVEHAQTSLLLLISFVWKKNLIITYFVLFSKKKCQIKCVVGKCEELKQRQLHRHCVPTVPSSGHGDDTMSWRLRLQAQCIHSFPHVYFSVCILSLAALVHVL